MTAPSDVNRREFLRATSAAAAAAAVGRGAMAAANRPGKAPARPNVIVIMSDEHNGGVMGCAGDKIVRTPNMDAIAARGVTFENCYCNSPLCVPSRLSFTAGKYVSRIGAWSNDCWLAAGDEVPSLPRILNAAGYESLLCGKMHYDATRRYGFADLGGNMNRGRKTGKGARRKADDLAPKPGISGRFKQFHAGDSGVLQHDRKVTAGTVEFLANRKAGDKPFFLLAGYLAPHFPLIVPQKYWDAYKGKVPMPTIPDGHLESQARNYKHLRIGFNVEDVPETIVRKGRELYYGLTQWLDDEIGKLLAALAGSQVADNTLVVYTTDHGENMGEHGLWWKNCVYDSAARIPLIVSWPARWKGPQRRTGVCSLVDLVQTLADIGGADVPADWNGRSMLTWLDDAKSTWRDLAVSEYYAHNISSGYAMIRMGRYKYTYHTPADANHPAERELYDVQADPGEFKNLAAEPAHATRIAAMHKALIAELGEHPDQTERRCRADYAKGYGRAEKPARKKAKKAKGNKT